MQPSGLVSISGIASATPFLKGFFDRWHVQPQFVAREEYKNVINQFTQVSAWAPACVVWQGFATCEPAKCQRRRDTPSSTARQQRRC